MLKAVIAGKTYDAVAADYGVTRTAVERRIKACALKLNKEVGIEGINEEGIAFVQRLRKCQAAVIAAIERYTPTAPAERRVGRILTDDDIAFAVRKTRMRSTSPQRDVALLYVLLSTGARPLEIARLEVRDYLNPDGSVDAAFHNSLVARDVHAIAVQPDGKALIGGKGVQGNGESVGPAISRGGWFVALASQAGNLVPGDTNGVGNVFVRDRRPCDAAPGATP